MRLHGRFYDVIVYGKAGNDRYLITQAKRRRFAEDYLCEDIGFNTALMFFRLQARMQRLLHPCGSLLRCC